jgi:hypothetical protein
VLLGVVLCDFDIGQRLGQMFADSRHERLGSIDKDDFHAMQQRPV